MSAKKNLSGGDKTAGLDLATQALPFETESLRQALVDFLETPVDPDGDGQVRKGLCRLG